MAEAVEGRSLLGEALKWLRESHRPRLTQEALAEATRVPKGSISSVEAGVSRNPRPHVLDPLLGFYGLETAQDAIEAYRRHVGDANGRYPTPANDPVSVELTDQVVEVRVYAEASAGRGSGARLNEVVKVAASEARGRKLIGIRIRGKCMWPRFMPGDTVLFEKVNDDEVLNGDTVCVTLLDEGEDGAYLVKYLAWARNGEEKVILTAEDDTRIEVLYDRVVIEGKYWRMIRD